MEENLIPFDLERAKCGDAIRTRDGRPARFIAHVPEARNSHRVVYLDGKNVMLVSEDGLYSDIPDRPLGCDLFMVDEPTYKPTEEECRAWWLAYNNSPDNYATYALKREHALKTGKAIS